MHCGWLARDPGVGRILDSILGSFASPDIIDEPAVAEIVWVPCSGVATVAAAAHTGTGLGFEALTLGVELYRQLSACSLGFRFVEDGSHKKSRNREGPDHTSIPQKGPVHHSPEHPEILRSFLSPEAQGLKHLKGN